jgi:hypothetical protein
VALPCEFNLDARCGRHEQLLDDSERAALE